MLNILFCENEFNSKLKKIGVYDFQRCKATVTEITPLGAIYFDNLHTNEIRVNMTRIGWTSNACSET